MPLAQWHYPFEQRDLVDAGIWYPADFICEAIDQTRGWFYSLHAIAALLEQATKDTDHELSAPSYRNVICLGHILDAKGEKMSKSRGNVVNPWEVINAHGADAIRWYLYSATPPGNSRRFSAQLVAEAVRTFLLTLWNTYSFFVTYANIDGFDPRTASSGTPSELDRWITSRLHTLVADVTAAMDAYDPTTASRKIQAFVDDLSNWYVRRSRRRFWKSENDGDKAAAYRTLYAVLVTLSKLLAPFTPFVAEAMYQNLARRFDADGPESVHLADYPRADDAKIDLELERSIDLAIRVTSLGRAARSKAKVRVRQPLAELKVMVPNQLDVNSVEKMVTQIKEELNVKKVWTVVRGGFDADVNFGDWRVSANMAKVGPKYGPRAREVAEALGQLDPRMVAANVRAGQVVSLPRKDKSVPPAELSPDEIIVTRLDPQGCSVVEDTALTVAVTTEISPELALEGLAREIVHRIQTMRKAAGFEIADRIVTYYETRDAALAKAFEAHGAYISQETLSERLVASAAPADAYVEQQAIEGKEAVLAIQRTGKH